MERANDSPATPESQSPTFLVSSGMVGVPTQMPGVVPQMPGIVPQMPGMVPQMQGMVLQMPGMMPEYYNIHPWAQMMQQMVPPQPAAVGNVYRPTIDFLTGVAQTCTPMQSQFTSNETFSLKELSLSPMEVPPTQIPTAGGGPTAGERRAHSKKKGKAKAKAFD